MDLPRSVDQKCVMLRERFRGQVFKTIAKDERLGQTWKWCLSHQTLQFDFEVIITFGQEEANARRKEGYQELRSFVETLTSKTWERDGDGIREIKDAIARDQKDMHVVLILHSQPKEVSMVRVEHPNPVKEAVCRTPKQPWELSTNDRRFLRALRIASDHQSEVE